MYPLGYGRLILPSSVPDDALINKYRDHLIGGGMRLEQQVLILAPSLSGADSPSDIAATDFSDFFKRFTPSNLLPILAF